MFYSSQIYDRSLLEYAYSIARKSRDPSTQNGAILVNPKNLMVVAVAYNDLPPAIDSCEDYWKRPQKYQVVEHAERGVIYTAAKDGIATKGLLMVCPWAACPECARAIICSGITKLIIYRKAYEKTAGIWKESINTGLHMLREAGVEVVDFNVPLHLSDAIRFNGEEWLP